MKIGISNAGEESMLHLEAETVGEGAAIATFVSLLGGRGHDVLQVLDDATRIESISYTEEPGAVISGITFASKRLP